MTVAELEAILARLPEDMLVVVGFPGDHIEHIETENSRLWSTRTTHRCETGRCEIPNHDDTTFRVPPYVRISGAIGIDKPRRSPRDGGDPPPVKVGGRAYWRKPRKPREVVA